MQGVMYQLACVQSRALAVFKVKTVVKVKAVVKVKVYSRCSGDVKAEGCLRELFYCLFI
jgi:hypothetical protein